MTRRSPSDSVTVWTHGKAFATFEHMTGGVPSAPMADPSQRVRLSPFAFLHAEEGALVLETALSDVRATLVDPRSVLLVTSLVSPASARDLADATGCESDVASAFVDLLVRAGLAIGEGAGVDAVAPPSADAWEFHDLLFHRRTRSSPLVRSSGRRVAARAARNPDAEGSDIEDPRGIVPIPRDDDAASLIDEATLGWSLTRRRSRRTFGGRPLTVSALGEFLFRSAGVSGDGATGAGHRPYPSGGGCYPLEIYPLVVRCDGLAAGVYRYDAFGHRLCFRAPVSADVEALIAGAVPDPEARTLPHVVLVIAARFARTQTAYEAIGYSLILKEVGTLMQTMYLVAAAMELAGCAIGWGDADLFARATGLPALLHGSVGEFALGVAGGDGRI